MGLMLLGWLLPSDDERALLEIEAERERQVGASWGLLYGRESQLMEDRELRAALSRNGY